MKKIALLLLIVSLVFVLFAFAGCGDDETDTPPSSSNNGNVNPDTPGADEDLQAAYDYIKLTYKTLSTTTTSFEIMKNAPIGDKVFAITWSTDNDAITITETEDGNFYVVNIPALGDAAVNYTLKFSIENEAGEKKEGSFNLTIPKFAVNTFDEYVAAEDGTPLIIQGIVTGVISKSTNSSKENSLFIQDLNGNGGYYAYNLAEDPNGVISVGMTVEVRGDKKNYNGTFELVNPVATVIDSEIKPVTPVDFTEVLAGAASLDAQELTNKNGMLVTIKGVTILEYVEGNGYHYFKLGDHKTYLRVSSSSNCITKEEGKTLTVNFQSNFYNGADVTGIIAVYNNSFYLMPVSVDAFTNIVELEKPADVKVDTALTNTKLPGMIQIAGDTELPTSFSGFSDVTLTWELVATEGVNCATLNGNILTVTIPESAQTVTLKATATCGDVSDSKDFTIIVKPISTITIMEANNIGMNMAHNTYTEELYYITGVVENIANATYGNLFIVDGEFSVYIYGLYDATGKVRYDSMNPQPLVKDTIKVLSSVGKYSNDVQLKNAKVVEHTVHEDNKVEVAPTVDFKPVNPIVDTEYYFAMVKNDVVYFITGSMGSGSAQYYMASTSNNDEAAKVTVVAGPTEGTYYITLTVEGATKYMDLVVSGTHKNAVYVDAAPEVGFSFDAEYKVFYKVLDDANYTFGTALSNNYTTIGAVKVSADNAMLQISFAEEHTCTFTDVVTAPTCDVAGYTTHTCACGNVVVDTEVDALGHAWGEDGTCTRGECDASNHEHVYDAVVTNPTCEAAGYTTYTCNVEGCKKSYVEDGEAALGHSYTDGVCVNGCGAEDPDYYKPVTITEALALADGKKVKVTGTVIKINTPYSSSYNNISVTIADGSGDTLYLYRLTGNVALNDIITVSGVMATYNDARQIAAKATATIDGTHTCTEYTEATCQAVAECVVCGTALEGGVVASHSYVEGVCSVCGHEEGAAEVVYATEKLEIAANTGVLSDDSLSISWSTDNFNFLGEKANSTTAIRTSDSDHFRIYAKSRFTVSGNNGQLIKTMVVKCTSSSYATALVNALTTEGVSAVADGTTVTFTAETGVTSIVFDASAQTRVESFEITYVVE